MRTKLLLASTALLLISGNLGAQEKQETILFTVTAEEIAKEFAKEPEAARKKYNSKAPPGQKGGAIINITGHLKSARDKELTLETNSKVGVVLRVKNIAGDTDGKQFVKADSATLKEFKNGKVILECSDAKLTRIIGKDKN